MTHTTEPANNWTYGQVRRYQN